MRILSSSLEHHVPAQARDTFHFDATSVFIDESDATRVFANPAGDDYHLKAGSAAAIQCVGMGI